MRLDLFGEGGDLTLLVLYLLLDISTRDGVEFFVDDLYTVEMLVLLVGKFCDFRAELRALEDGIKRQGLPVGL